MRVIENRNSNSKSRCRNFPEFQIRGRANLGRNFKLGAKQFGPEFQIRGEAIRAEQIRSGDSDKFGPSKFGPEFQIRGEIEMPGFSGISNSGFFGVYMSPVVQEHGSLVINNKIMILSNNN